KQQYAEAVEASILQGKAVLGLIHAEAARAARTRREEHIVADNVLPRHSIGFEPLEVLDQIADGEVCRIALAVVAIFLAELECRHIRTRHDLALVATAVKHSLDQGFVLPR